MFKNETYRWSDLENQRQTPCPCRVHLVRADHGAGGGDTSNEKAAVAMERTHDKLPEEKNYNIYLRVVECAQAS